MKFSLRDIRESLGTLSRKIGYRYIGKDEEKQEWSFIRILEVGGYPRFHLFIQKENNDEWFFKLHLDQKRPSYRGTPSHAGEYEGDVLKREANRIKEILEK